MMNYIKSEFYRISRTKSVYGFTLIFSIISLLINGLLGWYNHTDPNFLYGTTSYAYSIHVGAPMTFVLLAILITEVLYAENHRNGTLKNTVAFGISRIKIFTGMSVVVTSVATIVMVVILGVYILSANILLKHTGPVHLNDLLTEILAIYLIAMAAIMTTLFFSFRFSKSGLTIFLSFMVWMVIPSISQSIARGLKIEWLNQLLNLLPNNLFENMQVNLTQSITAWGTSGGMLKCVVIGLVHVIGIYLLSCLLLAKKDI